MKKRIKKEKKRQEIVDIEYIGIISSLEILIVFGCFIPILIPIYNVIMFGYGLVYYYWLNIHEKFDNNKGSIIHIKVNDGNYVKIVAWWLLLSMAMQQTFGLWFYGQTQGQSYLIVGLINVVLLIGYFVAANCFHCNSARCRIC